MFKRVKDIVSRACKDFLGLEFGSTLKGMKEIIYHISIVALSGAAALSLPYTGRFVAQNYQKYWSFIENNKVFLISVEIAVAVFLIALFNYLGRSWKDRKRSRMAARAGLVLVTSAKRPGARKKMRKLKENHGLSRDVMLIGSTGFGTFVSPDGDLHQVIQNCREAQIMLLNPFGEGASIRAKSMPNVGATPESFKEQILKSIDFLRSLREVQKNIWLKLYPDAPFLKLTILGDYVCVQFYNTGMSLQEMPEYIFKLSRDNESLYGIFYQYFLSRWRDPSIPEYDFDTGELVYRDNLWNVIRKEKFN
ncbi:MAG: hypothetical protein A4E65_02144 [Syntrophorhabdus sp. PtaU1.Bin153]|nr:MAG: hypothetical protein A4E65_02144 [Syntrophorhabdus sp. PtaU1.Bin153]